MSGEFLIRQLADRDWEAVVALEHDAYAADGLSEGREALQSRVRCSPQTCYVLEQHGTVRGYLLSLPYPPLRCPDLAVAEDGAFDSDNLHLHDLVLAEDLRGRELASVFMDHVSAQAVERGFAQISMVAVRGSDILLRFLGYRAHREVALPASYGRRAVYMSKPVG
ncbi:GNAT family N-acetyltransferase [Kitasatospora sp. NPDC006697]|uniref:GNAT family N-acetyltransferase n=1 Tax=Kitasatospora sp. NPDC006697 TaxID=3364020 RepID=UPI0036A6A7E1